jgi:hypothetical protein
MQLDRRGAPKRRSLGLSLDLGAKRAGAGENEISERCLLPIRHGRPRSAKPGTMPEPFRTWSFSTNNKIATTVGGLVAARAAAASESWARSIVQ